MSGHTREGVGRALAASRRDPEAFRGVYVEFAPRVLRFFAYRTRQGQVALDLTAETFAKAFECRRDFRGRTDEQASAWLWTIARSQLAMYWRHREVELASISRLGLERPHADDDELARIVDRAAVEQAGDLLHGIYAELSEDHREVIQLHVVEQMGYREIVERLALSNEVVRARASRALRVLAERARAVGLVPGQE